MRAATTGLGVLRGLHELGVFTKARYLSTTSGGSWLNGAVSFNTQSSLEEFLGPYVPPDKLTPHAAKHVGHHGKSFAAALAQAEQVKTTVESVAANLLTHGWDANKARGWTRGVAAAFLAPFSLGDVSASTTCALGTRDDVIDDIYEKVAFADVLGVVAAQSHKLPYPIMTQCVLQASDPRLYFPAEWTPMYAGVPVPVKTADGSRYGSGYAECLGMNSKFMVHRVLGPTAEEPRNPESSQHQSATYVEVERDGPYTLAEAVGVSSCYISYSNAKKLSGSEGRERLSRILGNSTHSYWDLQGGTTKQVQFTDGGGTDYLGIHPLLRRKVTRIVSCVASKTDPAGMGQAQWATENADVAAAFGAYPGNTKDQIPLEDYNRGRQVFETAAFAKLFEDISSRCSTGGPVWHRASLAVMDNAFLGVQGGWTADVLFIFNCTQSSWEAELPAETRRLLEAQRASKAEEVQEAGVKGVLADTELRSFPLIPTMSLNYSPLLVGMLSNLATYSVVSLEAHVRELAS